MSASFSCRCGRLIVSEVGSDFVVTAALERKWMRRRHDCVVCPACRTRYEMRDLTGVGAVHQPTLSFEAG